MDNSSVPFWTAVAAMAAVGTACVTSIYTYLTLKLFRTQAEPKVILYVKQNEHNPFVLLLVVENIGKDIATNIVFSPSRVLPEHAYGLSVDTDYVAKVMDSGPIVEGIPSLEPGGMRELSWGQFGGLTKALGGSNIIVDISFMHGNREMTSHAVLEVASFSNVTANDTPQKKIVKQLEEINRNIRRIADHLDPLVVKPYKEDDDGTIG
ncbi:MAG: hypothetical protein KKF77_08345 [Proteobacteria bacterium]|nr:hypothetical protein [Pseudomonadota bacterium]